MKKLIPSSWQGMKKAVLTAIFVAAAFSCDWVQMEQARNHQIRYNPDLLV
jgi:hypothetical protein